MNRTTHHALARVLVLACAHVVALACATEGSAARIEPDDAKPTADISALAAVTMCTSTYEEAEAALGTPYRDGMAHKLRIAVWKVTPGEGRTSEPLAIAFKQNVAVDICYDLPGMVKCEMRDECSAP